MTDAEPVGAHLQISGFQIAMNDASLLRMRAAWVARYARDEDKLGTI